MNPLNFLKVADNLKDSSKESERRTAVSRAYYSVFNYIKSYLVQHQIFLPSDATGHVRIIQYLRNSGIKEAKQLARMIADLRTDRNEADYDMDSTRFNKDTSILIFLRAKKAVKNFRHCRGQDFIDGINDYRNRVRMT